MEDFEVSVAGILKLLKNLKPNKAAGPDKLKPLLIQELMEEIAPILQVILEPSILTGNSQQTGAEHRWLQFSKKETSLWLRTTDLSPSLVSFARFSNI